MYCIIIETFIENGYRAFVRIKYSMQWIMRSYKTNEIKLPITNREGIRKTFDSDMVQV